jgi:alkylation response protein AidB-like acyl-CoA dehydrogenase
MLHLDAEASYRHRDGAHRLSPVGHTAFGQRKRAFHTRFLVLAIVRETEEGPVYLTMTEEQQDLQDELRSYFMGLVAEVEGAGESESTYTRYIRRMGADGWLGIGWPEEYGGRAQGPVEQMIFVEESHWAGVPLPLLTLNSVGPTLMAVGTDEQKQRILPGILRGEVHFSIGYTEPSAGTDLASLRTRAVRDGDEYVINGEKIWVIRQFRGSQGKAVARRSGRRWRF